MTASRQDIIGWYDTAEKKGCTHLIVGLDPMDYDNFPIYIMPGTNVQDEIDRLTKTGNRYDEVYAMHLGKESQMAERRALHTDYPQNAPSSAQPKFGAVYTHQIQQKLPSDEDWVCVPARRDIASPTEALDELDALRKRFPGYTFRLMRRPVVPWEVVEV